MNPPVFVKTVWRFCLDGNSFAFFVAGDVAVEFWTGQTSFHSAASVFSALFPSSLQVYQGEKITRLTQ